ncbi:MAG: hypothetical protein QF464_13510, partial [Myxococcota bacterium]|nr:hypothetical protein [Myxococcota bacterium]
ASCTGADQKYFSVDICLDYCTQGGAFPPGQAGDTDGHSVACRAGKAAAAANATGDELSALCDIAGPSGGGICGSPCELYCSMALQSCTGSDTLYPHLEACEAACASIVDEGVFGDQSGDTVQCRISSLGVAGSTTGAARSAACVAAGLMADSGCQAPTPTCQTYCGTVMAACGDGQSLTGQYVDEATCLATCEGRWEPGAYDDSEVDTLGCRLHRARLAVADPDGQCEAAGPSGGGLCGTWCAQYCGMAEAYCTGDDALYTSPEICASACGAMDTSGWVGATDGQTIQCRITHLGLVAAGGEPSTHCPDASALAGDACVGETTPRPPSAACEAYCDTVTAACTGEDAAYADVDACLDYCWAWARLPVGPLGDTVYEGNTLACRSTLATSGFDDPCDLAGPLGGGQCGSWCDNYCHLAQTNCTGDHALYDSTAACQTACALFPDDGAEGDESGDTVQCRAFALGLAGSQSGETSGPYCLQGSANGDGVCVDSAKEQASWSGDVQAALKARCGACHAGVSTTDCPGGACFATHFEATQLPAYSCLGETKGGCLLSRAITDDVTHGSVSLPDDDRATLQAWLDAGQPE